MFLKSYMCGIQDAQQKMRTVIEVADSVLSHAGPTQANLREMIIIRTRVAYRTMSKLVAEESQGCMLAEVQETAPA